MKLSYIGLAVFVCFAAPNAGAEDPNSSVSGLVGKSWRLNEAGNHEDALKALDEADRIYEQGEKDGHEMSNILSRHTNRTAALQALNRHGEALAAADRMVASYDNWDDAFQERGLIRHRAGKFDEAIADFSKAFVLIREDGFQWESKCSRVIGYRADAHEAAGRKDKASDDRAASAALGRFGTLDDRARSSEADVRAEAIVELNGLLKLLPDLPDAWRSRAIARAINGDSGPAEADFRKQIELAPGEADPLADLASFLADEKRFEEALEISAQAIAAAEDETQRRVQTGNRGRVHFAAADFQSAVKDFDVSISTGAQPERELRARAHLELGNSDEAEADSAYLVEVMRSLVKYGDINDGELDLAAALEFQKDVFARTGKGEEAQQASGEAGRLRKRVEGRHYHQVGIALANREGDWEGAIEALDRASAVFPDEPALLRDRISTLTMLERYEDALADAKRLEKVTPNDPQMQNLMGFVFSAQKRYEEALPWFEKALQQWPGDLRILRNRAGILGELGRKEEETARRKQIRDLLVQNNGEGGAASQFFRWGQQYQEKREFAYAIKEFNDALLLNPEAMDARAERARCLLNVDRYEDAIEDCGFLIRKSPEFADAYFLRGIALAETGQDEKAIADFSRSIEFEPENLAAASNRAMAFHRTGELEKAITELEGLIEEDPEWLTPLENLADIHLEAENDKEAFSAIAGILKLDPEHVGALWSASRIHERAEQFDLAAAMLDRYLELIPDNPDALNNRGWYRFKLGRSEEALKDFDSAIRLSPEDPLPLKNQITVLEELGREEAAEKARTQLKALEEAPEPD